MPRIKTKRQLIREAAIAGVVAPKDVTAAKRGLPQGQTFQVEETILIRGVMVKGIDTPEAEGTKPAEVDPFQAHVVAEVLRRLKVTPAQLRRAIRAALKQHDEPGAIKPEGAALRQVIEDEACSLAASMPQVPLSKPSRAGSVDCSGLTYTVLDSREGEPCRLAA
ncbi:MAG: hypothetical protein AAGI68_15555 [Planctomycetota bacterium]